MRSKFLGGAALLLLAAQAQAAADYPSGYTKCAQNTGATCSMSGTRTVALGKSGSFVYATKTGAFACIGSAFPSNAFTTSAWCSYGALASSSSSSASSTSTASSSSSVASSTSSSAASSSVSSSVAASSSSTASSSTSSTAASGVDASSLTGASTPFQSAKYGIRDYSAPVLVNKLHDPANYKAAPKLPTWQFATVDPTGGVLSFERATASQDGWHTWSRQGKVVVTGGSAAASNRVYTVFNGQQLVAAINEAQNEPKIIRVVGHIDLRWSSNNTVFKEFTSYTDQKFGGSIMIPSNTTLVGINDKNGNPARLTGTSILIGAELPLAAGGDPEADFKAWIAAGKDGETYPTWTRNVIIRNLKIDAPWDVNPEDSANAYADGMTISRAQNIYIDHVSMSDGDTPDSLASDTRHDGLLDIVRGSDYVSVTNSYFTKHHKTTLIGNGDSGRAWSDDGRLHVTLTGNWWDSAGARLPLNRFGQVHIFNNLVAGSTSTSDSDMKFESGSDARYQSNQLLQSNYYQFTGMKLSEACGKLIKGKDYKAFRSSGHLFVSDKADSTLGIAAGVVTAWDGQCSMTVPTGADIWTPPYAYSLQTAATTLSTVQANAGAGKLK